MPFKDLKRKQEYQHKWYERNKEKKYYKYNPEKYLEKREAKLEYWKNYRKDLKEEVFRYYGSKCNCCGETIMAFLSIDHIDPKIMPLHKGRKQIRSSYQLYSWLIKNNYPKEFQLLCMNCNYGKKINKGVCPHAEMDS